MLVLMNIGLNGRMKVKRSEALKKLKHFMSYQNPYDDRDIEDQILDYCERIIGMLPPFNQNDFHMDGDKADHKSIIYRTWEEE